MSRDELLAECRRRGLKKADVVIESGPRPMMNVFDHGIKAVEVPAAALIGQSDEDGRWWIDLTRKHQRA